MKKIKFSEIRDLKPAELRQRLDQLRRELFDSRMQLKMKRLSNPLKIRFLRRDIARLQTALLQNMAQNTAMAPAGAAGPAAPGKTPAGQQPEAEKKPEGAAAAAE